MATRRSTKKPTEMNPKIGALDIAAKKLISTIDTSYTERSILSQKDAEIQSILNSELELAKGVSQGSIIDFVTTMAQDSAKNNGRDPKEVDGYSLFTEDIGNLFGYFQELYKNRYIEMADLRFITKFIPAIGEAVKTTMDSIVSADDFSTSITRNIELGATLSEDEKATAQAEIERIERDEKLLKKLRTVVYPRTLVSGNHYVYCIPYSELFAEYDRLVKEGKLVDNMLVNNAIARGAQSNNLNKKKGFNLNGPKDRDALKAKATEATVDSAMESFSPASREIIQMTLESASDFQKEEKKVLESSLISKFEDVYVADTDVLVEALEGFSSAQLMADNLSPYRDVFAGNAIMEDKSVQYGADGTYADTMKPEKFSVQGSYIKYIDATKLVPIRVYNQVVGYFHVHDMSATKKANAVQQSGMSQTNLIASTSNVFSSTTLTDEKRNKAVQTIVDAISDGILSSFSNKFVNKHGDFKRLIADCIVANGFVNNSFQIQFIPAKYIIPFTVNENEDGIGQSILQDSLFPAKMLLSTIVAKLLLYMNKSGNKTIAYVRKGPIDVSAGNHVQRTIRMLQESNITFSDLLSTNLSFAKFSRNGNIQLPMAKNGDRLIDFETQEGQEIDMNTPMEEYLEKLAIMGTGVPSVIMEYTDAADYAKSLVTANMKFAGRVATLQADLEESTTELYKSLIKASSLDDALKNKVLNSFEFKLCRPRVLTNSNMADYLSQMDTVTTSLARLFMGDNDADEAATELRQNFVKQLSIDMLPFVPWDQYQKIMEDAKVEQIKKKDLDKKADAGMDDGLGGGADDEFL